MGEQRNSDAARQACFSVYVWFDQPLDFSLDEIAVALGEDYPEMRGWQPMLPGYTMPPISTEDVIVGCLTNDDPVEGGLMSFSGVPGALSGELVAATPLVSGFESGRPPAAKFRRYVSITIDSKEHDIASRFRAMRALTCLTAVLAGLPTCVAVYHYSARLLVAPGTWVGAAKTAVRGEWPLPAWTAYRYFGQDGDVPQIGCASHGLAAFTGHDVTFMPAPVSRADATLYVLGAQWMLTTSNNQFADGDTMGLEGSDEKLRLRFVQESSEQDVDRWMVFHPGCPIDDVEMYGDRQGRPRSPDTNREQHADPDFFRRLLGATRRQDPPTAPH